MFKKDVSVVAGALFSLAWVGPLHLTAQEFPEADISPGTVVVDGIIDGIWETVEEQSLSVDIDQTAPEAPDFAGYWKGLWDETHLYLLMVTFDDVTVSTDPGTFWNYDVTELFIDPDNSKGTTYDLINDSQFVWPRNGDSSWGHTNPLGLVVPFANEALVQENGRVIIEVALPLAELGIAASAGTKVGLDVYMKDNDSGEASRDNQISWGPSADTAWRDASVFGTITFVEAAEEFWFGYSVDANGWADTGDWMHFVNVTYQPWIWVVDLSKYTYVGDDSGWVYVPN